MVVKSVVCFCLRDTMIHSQIKDITDINDGGINVDLVYDGICEKNQGLQAVSSSLFEIKKALVQNIQ
jgi:hypothetical protein